MPASLYVFVLWGRNFNEAAATIFVTELRRAGVRVKVVGLDGDAAAGSSGLTLVPDIPLSKALPLAGQSACVVVPCDNLQWQRIQADPRLHDFLQQSQASGAQVVTEAIVPAGAVANTVNTTISGYPEQEQLTTFARALAGTLSQRRHLQPSNEPSHAA